MNIKTDKTLFLLGILRSHQSHGYELQALLSSPLAPIQIGKANAYQLLNGFEKNGWVTGHEEREGNRPPRRVYSITSDGENTFQALLRERLGTHSLSIHADAVSLNFLSLLPATEAVALLSQRLEAVQARLDELRAQGAEDAGEHYGVDYLLKHTQFEADWLGELIDRMNMQDQ
jgi:DNA-binding PadR family transcriptional regulator